MFDVKDETDEAILRACQKLWKLGQDAKRDKAFGIQNVGIQFVAGEVKLIKSQPERSEP